MKTDLAGLISRLRLPSWQKADIEAELAAHLQEAVLEMRAQGRGKAEAQAAALARFGDLESLAESLQEIHKDWKGGATVQQRLVKKLVLGVILFCLIAVFALPPIREMGQSLLYSQKMAEGNIYVPPLKQLQKGAKQFPDDVYVQLALANAILATSEAKISRQRRDPNIEPALLLDPAPLRDVAARFPNFPAVHFQLGMQLLERSGELRRKEEYFGMSAEQLAHIPALREPTPEESADLNEAIQHLRTASRLAPDNSAPEYWLAYAWFAKKEDAQADVALRAALARPSWSIYRSEIQNASLKLYKASEIPALYRAGGVWAVTATSQFPSYAKARGLARMLAKLGEINRRNEKDRRALFYYQAGVYFSHAMIENADSFLDSMVGLAIGAMPGGSFVSREERQRIQDESGSGEERSKRMASLRQRYFREYLTAQGRADLADLNEADTARGLKLKEKYYSTVSPRQTDGPLSLIALGYRHLVLLLINWLFVAYILVIFLIVGLLSLFSRSWKAQGSPPVWRWRNFGWLVLALGVLFIAAIWVIPSHPELLSNSINKLLAGIFGSLMLIAVLLIALFPLIGALLKRRRQSPEARMRKSQAVLASYRLILPPLFAALLLFALVSTFTSQLKVNRWAEGQYRKIEQGEIQYWQNNSPEK